MSIWIVTAHMRNEGFEVIGLYSDHEKALAASAKHESGAYPVDWYEHDLLVVDKDPE